MSAPPMGMIRVTPATRARAKIAQNAHLASPPLITSSTISADDGEDDGDVQQVPGRQQDRRAAHVAVQLGEGDQRAGEGHRPDGHADGKLDQALQLDPPPAVAMP